MMCKFNRQDFSPTAASHFFDRDLNCRVELHSEAGRVARRPGLQARIEGRVLTMGTKMCSVVVRRVVLLAACLGVCTSASSADQPSASQMWLINSRRAPCSVDGGADAAQLEYWRLGADQWSLATQESFLAADDPAAPTVFFLHGNRSDEADVVREGCQFHQVLQCQSPDQALRYVIWSWPADRITGRARFDAQIKAARTDGQSYYVAQLLGRMNPRVPVCLVGHSFGARVITGAMHLLSGGEIAGQRVARENPVVQRALMRAVLVAAAEDFDWLAPGSCHGLALSQLDRVLITVNQADPALKHYSLLYGRGGPEALGCVGPAWGADGTKMELLDVSCSTGKTHKWDCYSADPNLLGRLPWYAFLASAPVPGYTANSLP